MNKILCKLFDKYHTNLAKLAQMVNDRSYNDPTIFLLVVPDHQTTLTETLLADRTTVHDTSSSIC